MEDTNQVQPRYINVKQAAKRLGIGESTLYDLIASEGLPVVRFGRAVRINPVKLDEWCDQREAMQKKSA